MVQGEMNSEAGEASKSAGEKPQREPAIPDEMRAIVLDGVGFSHLGVRRVPTPRPGPQQMLARVDAAGICTSLIKLIEQGPNHPLLSGWDITRFPLILGDEGSVTLVEVGPDLRARYCPGQRYVIQPAVDSAPINHRERYRDHARGVNKVAVGYTLGGHLAEYILISEEVLAAGCLLPLPDATLPYAHAALSEPFSCVISAQDHHLHLTQGNPLGPRGVVRGLKPGGVTVILGAGAMGRMHVALAMSYRPRAIVVADLVESRLELVMILFGSRAAALRVGLRTLNPAREDLQQVVNELTNYAGADDVIVAVGARQAIADGQSLLGRGAVLNLFGGLKKGEDTVGFDTSLVHYKEINITGSSGGSPWDVARTLELMAAREIDAGDHIARIGDLAHTAEFLQMIKAQAIDGKAVVYPHRPSSEILAVKSWTARDEKQWLVDSG
ncbi:MAG: zinc-binding dehydrogenase [Terriglobia bacterium]|jgi:threonine dehydrogenase-like Zn-dependent dehydrogenase